MRARLVAACVGLFGLLAATGCADDHRESAAPSTTTSSASAVDTTTTTETAVPPPDPDERVAPSEVGLPDNYAVDFGPDAFGEAREPRIRRDLATFALAVRDVDRRRADELAWTLQAFPAAVCLAGPRVEGGFESYVARVEERVVAMHAVARDRFGIDMMPTPTPATDPVLRTAADIARNMFCPVGRAPVGDATGVLPGWDPNEGGYIDLEDSAVPGWAQLGSMHLQRLGTFEAAAQYLATATAPDLVGWMLDNITAGSMFCSQRESNEPLAAVPTADRWADDGVASAEDLRASLGANLAYLAVVELACPPDWLTL